MNVNLEKLNSNFSNEIEISSSNLIFNEDDLKKSDILDLKNVKFNGKIYKDSSDEFNLSGILTGDMYVEDAIDLSKVKYPFSINIDENIEQNLENNQNTIDFIPILWQNIVLEVPLRYTKVNDISNYSGDGWKLISEEEVSKNNPFLELKEKFKEE